MTRIVLGNKRHRRGTEILELALLLGPIILIVLGGMDFGLFLYLKHNCQSAAREGARAGIVGGNIEDSVKRVMEDNAGIKDYDVESKLTSGSGGDHLTVTVKLNYQPLGVFTKFLGNAKMDDNRRTISGAVTMRVEP